MRWCVDAEGKGKEQRTGLTLGWSATRNGGGRGRLAVEVDAVADDGLQYAAADEKLDGAVAWATLGPRRLQQR